MRTKIGIIYCLSNFAWLHYKKIGRTTKAINKRLCNLQTSLLDNCVIILTTETLLDTHFYEFLLKKILSNYRLKTNKEFFDVDESDIEMIFDFFNELNQQFDTEEKLLKYIQSNHPEYFSKKRIYKSDSSNSSGKPKQKKKKGLFVDTSSL